MLGIFESHPVQYRAPVYRALQGLVPDGFHVFYATDLSLRGKKDPGFGTTVAWDEPLLSGYPNTVLGLESPTMTEGFFSLRGTGIGDLIRDRNLSAVLLPQFNYAFDLSVLLHAALRGIPVWIRQETQDAAFLRPPWKSLLRSVLYRILYTRVDHAFAIGEMNRRHLLRHGIPEGKISMARYCTPDRFAGMSSAEITATGEAMRGELGIDPGELVVGFFGKLIPKKNPGLLLEAAGLAAERLKRPIRMLFVGSGELEPSLREKAAGLVGQGIRTVFTGFVNQSAIARHYAATDIMVLPSRRMGETWGLVVNESLQAGCSVAMSDAVGCHREFGILPHCRVFAENDARGLADSIVSLADNSPADRTWARTFMEDYSTEVAAGAIAAQIRKLASVA